MPEAETRQSHTRPAWARAGRRASSPWEAARRGSMDCGEGMSSRKLLDTERSLSVRLRTRVGGWVRRWWGGAGAGVALQPANSSYSPL